MSYAKGTSVSCELSRAEIVRILTRYGCNEFGFASEARKAMMVFGFKCHRVRFICLSCL
jgi:hypothetical protein